MSHQIKGPQKMAVTMTTDLKAFVDAVFAGAPHHPEYSKMAADAQILESKGWKFSFAVFLVSAVNAKFDTTVSENMPVLITRIISGQGTTLENDIFRKAYIKFMQKVLMENDAYESGEKIAPDKAKLQEAGLEVVMNPKFKLPLGGPGQKGETGALGQPTMVKLNPEELTAGIHVSAQVPPMTAKKPAPKKASGPVPLAHATDLGQPVNGTSEGSVYYTVAVSPTLNVAVREVPSGVSVRVEGIGLSSHGIALATMGFSVKPSYASIHAESGHDLPASRIVGALLMSMGVNFTQMATNASVWGGKTL